MEPGQHWVILGANGSGKTSLLNALTGYLTPSEGEIAVLGRSYGNSDWRELREHIGFVSSSIRQMMPNNEPALDTVVSGKSAMIDFWGRATRTDRAAAGRILRQIECSHLARRPWLVLSQGERQRVLIGRALMAKPNCSSWTSLALDSTPAPASIFCNSSSASAHKIQRRPLCSSRITWRKSCPFSRTCCC